MTPSDRTSASTVESALPEAAARAALSNSSLLPTKSKPSQRGSRWSKEVLKKGNSLEKGRGYELVGRCMLRGLGTPPIK
jgi:hypothetical protein